ncbi:MAG: hypothetical protein K0S41_201 [Anaerocolumna sp.]|jgi:hypothetical protein|nr:hypothetical protein [Anaerocolumna sp.]
MCKYIKTLVLVIIVTFSLSIDVSAESISLSELIENGTNMDGEELTIQGEAIGESMNRGDYSWININDGSAAIGVWLKSKDAEKVSYFGNYKYIGDTIKLKGHFYRACKEHGGEADFHADSFEIVKEGHETIKKISNGKLVSAGILSLCAMIVLFLFRQNKKR